jgi:hypothetical protein
MTAIHDDCGDTLETAREAMNRYVDKDGLQPPEYSEGNLVILSGTNIRTLRPCQKLDYKLHGPFTITDVVSETAMCLNLTVKWKIYNVFQVSLLEPFI